MAMAIDHWHKCCVCQTQFTCEYTRKECESKGVSKSVAVNGDGPYCLLCYHTTMSVRTAVNRKLKQVAFVKHIALVWSREKNRPNT